MSPSSKPSIVLVHGAWHSPAHFSTLRSALESHDYEVTAPQLPSVGADPGLPDANLDVATVRSAIEELVDQGKDVVVVMHFYGGLVDTEACKGFAKSTLGHGSAGVVALVYMTACLPLEGESLASSVRKGGVDTSMAPHSARFDKERLQIHHLTPIESLYHDCDPDEAAKAVELLRPHSFATFSTPLTYEAWREIPSTYLYCDDDRAIPYKKQVQMVEMAREARGVEIETVTLEGSGHSPFLKDPEFVAGVIRKAAGEAV